MTDLVLYRSSSMTTSMTATGVISLLAGRQNGVFDLRPPRISVGYRPRIVAAAVSGLTEMSANNLAVGCHPAQLAATRLVPTAFAACVATGAAVDPVDRAPDMRAWMMSLPALLEDLEVSADLFGRIRVDGARLTRQIGQMRQTAPARAPHPARQPRQGRARSAPFAPVSIYASGALD